MRLLVILYAGDYRDAYRRMVANEGEAYHGHRYALKSLINIGQKIEEVAVLCCRSEEPYNQLLEPGFRVIGTGFCPETHQSSLLRIIKEYQPSHVVLRAPMLSVLGWLTRHQIPSIMMFADSFLSRKISARFKYFWMARQLNQPCVKWVSNHGINACQSLHHIGVKADKLIPWDWPYTRTPRLYSPKQLSADDRPWNLIYVGSVNKPKGVGDVLDAIAHLKHKQRRLRLKIAGRGNLETFSQQAKHLGIEDAVDFLGLVPNHSVVEQMRAADLVLVPSHHEYPEGFPLTIYEALCARTPLVASDHPMFRGFLVHETNAMVFPATHSTAIADCIEQIMTDAALYHQLSTTALDTWEKLQIPVKWAELIERWLFNSPQNSQWLLEHRLNSGKYDHIVKPPQLALN
ncbi:MAG: glycosyltransferase [Cyanobacteria bacterium J06635_1]